MYLKEITEEEFDKFTKAYFIKSIYQTKEYAHVMYNQGFSFKYIGFIIDNKIIGASLILIKKINRLIKIINTKNGIYCEYELMLIINLILNYINMNYDIPKNIKRGKINIMILTQL